MDCKPFKSSPVEHVVFPGSRSFLRYRRDPDRSVLTLRLEKL